MSESTRTDPASPTACSLEGDGPTPCGVSLVTEAEEQALKAQSQSTSSQEDGLLSPLPQSEEAWRQKLDPWSYHILREKGTERPFTGQYWNCHDPGTYRCAGCGQALFDAATKFDSGTGWPSFFAPLEASRVTIKRDVSHGMLRQEVLCARCQGHLGHVFPDGPRPTGLRYCINAASLRLQPKPASSPLEAG